MQYKKGTLKQILYTEFTCKKLKKEEKDVKKCCKGVENTPFHTFHLKGT